MRSKSSQVYCNAPLLVGAFFLLLGTLACKEKSPETAQWVTTDTAAEIAESSEVEVNEQPLSSKTSGEEVRFLSYNLKNYLTMRRGSDYLPKPEKEVDALIQLITEQKPDILGLCEIGKREDLKSLQARLKQAGLDLPHSEHTGGQDRTRHLGFLSRYPIVATDSQSALSYEMEGQEWVISRGILDATVEIEGTPLRFLGVHLKSKRPIEEADQEIIRQNEARLLRDHASAILEDKPDTHLIAYGDFNDTVASKTLSIVRSRRNSKKHLADFFFKDSRGEVWTHFWDYQDLYSRFDYVLTSQAMNGKIVNESSYIVEAPAWKAASDHRALMIVFRP